MRYLLDTHVLLWILFDKNQLSQKAKTIIKNLDNEIFASVISYWEISLKYNIGKLIFENITPDEIPLKAKQIQISTLNLSEYDVSTFYKLPRLEHKDPFDRLIIWQAINQKIPLISKDRKIKEYKTYGLDYIW